MAAENSCYQRKHYININFYYAAWVSIRDFEHKTLKNLTKHKLLKGSQSLKCDS